MIIDVPDDARWVTIKRLDKDGNWCEEITLPIPEGTVEMSYKVIETKCQ